MNYHINMKWTIVLVFVIAAVLTASCSGEGNSSEKGNAKVNVLLKSSKKTIKGIREIAAADLKGIRESSEVVMVDRRNPDEQAVSIIEGAITSGEFEGNIDEYKERPIVVYCTVGGRSGTYTKELNKKGIEAVNLKGGIIAWTHTGGKLIDPHGNETKNVHTMGQGQKKLPPGYVAVH